MINIQVMAEQKHEIYDAHNRWLQSLPRSAGQIGHSMQVLREGPPLYIEGEITPYSDFDPIRFTDVDPGFVAFLKDHDISFRED